MPRITPRQPAHCHLARPVLGLAVLVGAMAAAGCFSTPAEREPPGAPFGYEPDVSDPRFGVFVPERIDAVLGERLVIPVELAGSFRPEDVGDVRLDDGRFLPTRLVWVRRNPEAGATRTWLPDRGTPEVIGIGEPGAGVGEGSWVIAIDPPVDAVGQGFWLAGQRAPVNWLPDPAEVALRTPSEAWSSPLPAGIRRAGSLERLLGPLLASPERRWRDRLVRGTLEPGDQRRIVGTDGSMRRDTDPVAAISGFDDEVLDALAGLTDARWIVGLARLYEADTDLNLAVRRRLCSVVDFGEGAIAPVWSTDADGTDRLLDDLTDQSLSLRERGRRASAWLDAQPTGVAWVLSDAGRTSVRGEPVTTVGLLNATWDSVLVTLEAWSDASGLDLKPVSALSVSAADIVSRPVGAARAALAATIGDERFQLLAPGADAEARPPGLRIDSLAMDLTLAELLAQRWTPDTRDPTSALLYLDHRDRWVLYAECQTPGAMPGPEDTLVVNFGALGSELDASVVASADGVVGLRDEGPAGGLGQAVEAEVGRYDGGWSLRLTIPERFIEQGRVLRFGLERRTVQGARSAWPRAMLPWQSTPPRAAVDLAAWSD